MATDWRGYAELLKEFPEQHKRILEGGVGDLEGCALPPPIRLELVHKHDYGDYHDHQEEDECQRSH